MEKIPGGRLQLMQFCRRLIAYVCDEGSDCQSKRSSISRRLRSTRRSLRRLPEPCPHAGYPVKYMTSGAGHDAMIMAEVVPSAMLFLRSPRGISHHPDEDVHVEDVAAALDAG